MAMEDPGTGRKAQWWLWLVIVGVAIIVVMLSMFWPVDREVPRDDVRDMPPGAGQLDQQVDEAQKDHPMERPPGTRPADPRRPATVPSDGGSSMDAADEGGEDEQSAEARPVPERLQSQDGGKQPARPAPQPAQTDEADDEGADDEDDAEEHAQEDQADDEEGNDQDERRQLARRDLAQQTLEMQLDDEEREALDEADLGELDDETLAAIEEEGLDALDDEQIEALDDEVIEVLADGAELDEESFDDELDEVIDEADEMAEDLEQGDEFDDELDAFDGGGEEPSQSGERRADGDSDQRDDGQRGADDGQRDADADRSHDGPAGGYVGEGWSGEADEFGAGDDRADRSQEAADDYSGVLDDLGDVGPGNAAVYSAAAAGQAAQSLYLLSAGGLMSDSTAADQRDDIIDAADNGRITGWDDIPDGDLDGSAEADPAADDDNDDDNDNDRDNGDERDDRDDEGDTRVASSGDPPDADEDGPEEPQDWTVWMDIADWLRAIQEQQYPELAVLVDDVEEAAIELDPDLPDEEQIDELVDFYEAVEVVLEAMAEESEARSGDGIPKG